jgi:hypothetical protein
VSPDCSRRTELGARERAEGRLPPAPAPLATVQAANRIVAAPQCRVRPNRQRCYASGVPARGRHGHNLRRILDQAPYIRTHIRDHATGSIPQGQAARRLWSVSEAMIVPACRISTFRFLSLKRYLRLFPAIIWHHVTKIAVGASRAGAVIRFGRSRRRIAHFGNIGAPLLRVRCTALTGAFLPASENGAARDNGENHEHQENDDGDEE